MIFNKRVLWLVPALLVLAGCNLPTPTAETPTEAPGALQVDPSPVASDGPASPEATSPATAQAAVPTSAPVAQNLRIAYTSDGNLWALEVGSDPVQLTADGGVSDVRVSDDGEWIAYVVQNPDQITAELHGASFDGGTHQLLLNAASFDALYPLGPFIHYTLSNLDFLPGTHTLLFNTRGVFEGPGLAKNDDLLSIDVTTGQITPLLARGDGGDFTASPDSDEIAIVRADSLSIANADGTGLRPEVLTFTPVITYSEYFFYPLPVWSGATVVLPVPQQDPFFAGEPGTVWSVNGEAQLLAMPEGDLFNPQREYHLPSPDGSSVAYFRAAGGDGEQHLVIERLGTGEEIIYDTGLIQWKGWGPESNRIVYTKGTGFDLYLGELGAPPAPLAPGTGLRWINSNEYLYVGGDPGGWTLMLADLAGDSVPLAVLDGTFVTYDFAE